jgi:hypothetical protein
LPFVVASTQPSDGQAVLEPAAMSRISLSLTSTSAHDVPTAQATFKVAQSWQLRQSA